MNSGSQVNQGHEFRVTSESGSHLTIIQLPVEPRLEAGYGALGRRVCGMKLTELPKAAELPNRAVVATNARRYEQRLETDRAEQARMKQVGQLFNCKM